MSGEPIFGMSASIISFLDKVLFSANVEERNKNTGLLTSCGAADRRRRHKNVEIRVFLTFFCVDRMNQI